MSKVHTKQSNKRNIYYDDKLMLICQLPKKSLYLNQTLLNNSNNNSTPSSSTIHPSTTKHTHTLNKKMTDIVLLHSPPQLPSSCSSSIINCSNNHDQSTLHYHQIQGGERVETGETEETEVSVLAVVVTVLRKSLVGCRSSIEFGGENSNCSSSGFEERRKKKVIMEIGLPTNVRHVAHVTFDRFNGFLGLPVEFEPEVPRRPPSASTRVFGVSTKSMQLSFDSRGNCVPTILLMMQQRLYSQGGLQYEGIFRINPENGQEEHVREQLNNGVIPENIDVHCLAGLIKAWFRELPSGILDSLPAEEVMEAESEDECARIVRLLPPTEAALLDWAINLMADVAQMESSNKMNARNIAMVFAPNMTQMSDPLTALMYAVQVMNFLKTLIVKTLRGRQECPVEPDPKMQTEPSDEDSNYSTPKPINLETNDEEEEEKQDKLVKETDSSQNHSSSTSQSESRTGNDDTNFLTSIENIINDENGDRACNNSAKSQPRSRRTRNGGAKKGLRKQSTSQTVVVVNVDDDQSEEKKKEPSIISRVNSHAERGVEVWR